MARAKVSYFICKRKRLKKEIIIIFCLVVLVLKSFSQDKPHGVRADSSNIYYNDLSELFTIKSLRL